MPTTTGQRRAHALPDASDLEIFGPGLGFPEPDDDGCDPCEEARIDLATLLRAPLQLDHAGDAAELRALRSGLVPPSTPAAPRPSALARLLRRLAGRAA
jgi:hypothetical protein